MGNTIASLTIKSATAATAYLNYLGTLANENVSNIIFAWIDASGSSVPIYNYFGGALTSTVKIFNKKASDIGGMVSFY